MRTEFRVFLRSYKDQNPGSSLPSPFRNCSNLSPFLTRVSCLGIREKLRLMLRDEHLDSSMENILQSKWHKHQLPRPELWLEPHGTISTKGNEASFVSAGYRTQNPAECATLPLHCTLSAPEQSLRTQWDSDVIVAVSPHHCLVCLSQGSCKADVGHWRVGSQQMCDPSHTIHLQTHIFSFPSHHCTKKQIQP